MKSGVFSEHSCGRSISNPAENDSSGELTNETRPRQVKNQACILAQQFAIKAPDSKLEPLCPFINSEHNAEFSLGHKGACFILDKDRPCDCRIPANSNRISITIPYEWLDGKYNYVKTQLIKGYNIFAFEMKRDSLNVSIEFYSINVKKTLEFVCTTYDLIFSEYADPCTASHSKNQNTSTLDSSMPTIDNNVADIKKANTMCNTSKHNIPKFNGYLPATSLESTITVNRVFKTKIEDFLHLNFLLMKILYSKKYNGILRTYSCKLSQSLEGNMACVIIYGGDRRSVNGCRREIEELYYSNIFVEVEGDRHIGRQCPASMANVYQENSCRAFVEISMAENSYTALFGNAGEFFKKLGTSRQCTANLVVNFETGNFICGKKMGKIHKIDSPYLKVLLVDEYKTNSEEPRLFFNFKIQGPVSECIDCYRQLLDEFPYEMCFSVDRRYHKRIIGVEGSVIQRIMKRYNFYVKFLSSKEADLLELEGNVILKTPRKNKAALDEAKREIFKYVDEEDAIKRILDNNAVNNVTLVQNSDSLKDTTHIFSGAGTEIDAEISFENIKKVVEMNTQKEKWY